VADGVMERIAAALESINQGVQDMAKSLATIAFKFTAPAINHDPVWAPNPTLSFTEGQPAVYVIKKDAVIDDIPILIDPDNDPLVVDIVSMSPEIANNTYGVTVFDLGDAVEFRYDGKTGIVPPGSTQIVSGEVVLSADDGKPAEISGSAGALSEE
jgi:hypothetical protein